MQDRRINPGDHDVQRHRERSPAESLHEPSGDQNRHGRGGPGDEQAQDKHGHRGQEGANRPPPVGPVPRGHHANDARGEGTGEGQRIKTGAVQFAAHDRHDGGHREGLKGR